MATVSQLEAVGFRVAQPQDIKCAHARNALPTDTSNLSFDPAEDPRLFESLVMRRVAVGTMGDELLFALPDDHIYGSWGELAVAANGMVDAHLEAQDFTEYASLRTVGDGYGNERPQLPDETMGEAKEVAHQGNHTTAAFLEVVPKVLSVNEYTDPNKEIAQVALNSLVFIAEWARLEGKMDYSFDYALAYPRPKLRGRKPEEVIFKDLHFGVHWFKQEGEQVVLDAEKAPKLRDQRGHPLLKRDQGTVPLFGCAALHLVIPIGKQMVRAAETSNLFGLTYEAARNGA